MEDGPKSCGLLRTSELYLDWKLYAFLYFDSLLFHNRLLEESVEKATWLVCTGIQANRASGNLLDFLIRWLKTAKNINDNFRFWIICEGIDALTLTTVQKCCSNFLGNEGSDDFKDAKDGEIPISAFAEAKERYYIDKFLIFLFHENQFVSKYVRTPYTLLFYQVEPLKNGASPILPSSLSRDS